MKLNVSFIKCVLMLYEEMQSNGISLVYMGEFNQDIITMFTGMAENTMDSEETGKPTKKRVYHALVEALENIEHHSDEISDVENLNNGFVIIGKQNDSYYIITSTKVKPETKAEMEEQLKTIANSDKDALNDLYASRIQDENYRKENGYAELGLLDIARKTWGNIDHMFLPLDDQDYAFILKVEINPPDDM